MKKSENRGNGTEECTCSASPSPCCDETRVKPFVVETINTAAGPVPCITGTLTASDHLGAFLVRFGIGRLKYKVAPGLYALGQPGSEAPVLVTANYKVSLDRLRSACAGRSAWILVLDTDGINVWCAAGKGTFGTDELAGRLQTAGLAEIVNHRTLILPQLSAPGISAAAVKKKSGFRVIYGPVLAEDLPHFLDDNLKATTAMRTRKFPLTERLALIPMELIPASKWMVVSLPIILLLGGIGYPGSWFQNVLSHGGRAAVILCGGLLAGTVATPVFLPWLPGRAFTVKGGIAGLVTGTVLLGILPGESAVPLSLLENLGLLLLTSALAAYLGFLFTGSSTYTSLSGVKKEMRLAAPLLFLGSAIGLLLWLGARFIF